MRVATAGVDRPERLAGMCRSVMAALRSSVPSLPDTNRSTG